MPDDPTHIDFCIKADHLQMQRITDLLGISPTSGFNPRERYQRKTRVEGKPAVVEDFRPNYGIWHYSTEKLLRSEQLEDHARFLLERLETAKAGIASLLRSSDYEIRMYLWHVGSSGFDISSELMRQLALLSKNITVDCFEPAEISAVD